jgi:hypothetical protein
MPWTLTAIAGAGKPEACTGKSTPRTGKSTPRTGKSTPRTGKSMPHTGAAFAPCLTSGGRAPLGRAARGA